MQHQQTQRQILEAQLAELEYKQRTIQRRLIQTQVQLELLNQQEERNKNINNNPSDNEDTNSNSDSSQDSNESNPDKDDNDSNDPTSDTDDNNSNANSEDSEHFRLPDGSEIYSGDSVIITNPSNINEQGGIIIGATPKRLKIKLDNGQTILRQPENLERAQTKQS